MKQNTTIFLQAYSIKIDYIVKSTIRIAKDHHWLDTELLKLLAI
jgi:hypothetical protein